MPRVARLPLPFLALALVALGRPSASPAAQAPPAPAPSVPDGWRLTWRDEFEGAALDRTRWDYDLGNGFYNYDAQMWIAGWGNAELQYYTREPENVAVAEGSLRIRALKESLHGFGYTSGRIKSRRRDGKALFAQQYGRFEFRARLPVGQGIWPALWLLPQDEKYGPWAASGEIDVMEARGQDPTRVLGTLHFGSRWPANTEASHTTVLPNGGTIADWHVYAVEWDPGEFRWYLDGKRFAAQSFWWSSGRTAGANGAPPAGPTDVQPWPAPFDQPFYLVMNLAVGGKFPGNPDRGTPFPAEMQVDYVRAYERVGGVRPLRPRGPGKFPFDPK
jgi:beta-glucanase (GH16 family)